MLCPEVKLGCKGICHRYKAPKPVGISRYEIGQKRCNMCGVFLKWDGLFCPCCNKKLRNNSRYTKYKERHDSFARVS